MVLENNHTILLLSYRRSLVIIVRAGVVGWRGGDPCGRPSALASLLLHFTAPTSTPHNVTPSACATVNISLSPRPERLTTTSVPGAILPRSPICKRYPTACASR